MQRKRKLQQLLSSAKFTVASRLASERYNNQNVKQLDVEHFSTSIHTTKCSSMQTITNSCNSDSELTLEDSFQVKRPYSNVSRLDNEPNWCPPNRDVSSLTDMDESVNSSNFLSSENIIVEDASIVDSDDLVQSFDSSSLKEKSQAMVKFLKGEYQARPVIPIGPGFQANVPEWTRPTNQETKNLKWLGTRVWPLQGRSTKSTAKAIGKGRPYTCSCVSRGSVECIKRHILEASMQLQCNLGRAFFSWKFDEMGEVVSKSWTLEEQRKFVSLMKCNPFSNEVSFLELASNYFPSKCQKNILSYYYNMFIPRRLSQLTRFSSEVDSDEDQVDGGDLVDDNESKEDDEDVEISIN